MGGFGRLGDELGDGGEFEAGSFPGWLESDWMHWPGSLSESGQGVTFRERTASLGHFSGHFSTLGFVLIMYDLDEILNFDNDF